jgi:hypothetical protein
LKFIIATLCLVIAETTQAISIRHDKSDNEYRANPKDYPFLVDAAGGHGTLISAYWVLTAAHIANFARIDSEININGKKTKVDSVFLHPSTNIYMPNWAHDIGLIRLSSPIKLAQYPSLNYDKNPVGKDVVFIGKGAQGNGIDGLTGEDRQLRIAHNTISKIDDENIYFVFTHPEDMALPLEGISGAGDSGGPALLYEKDSVFILGVGSLGEPLEGKPEGTYGQREIYPSTMGHIGWINLILKASKSKLTSLKYTIPPRIRYNNSKEGLKAYEGQS